eukprot:6195815-Pleurochrysis_carterae.AAC.1
MGYGATPRGRRDLAGPLLKMHVPNRLAGFSRSDSVTLIKVYVFARFYGPWPLPATPAGCRVVKVVVGATAVAQMIRIEAGL